MNTERESTSPTEATADLVLAYEDVLLKEGAASPSAKRFLEQHDEDAEFLELADTVSALHVAAIERRMRERGEHRIVLISVMAALLIFALVVYLLIASTKSKAKLGRAKSELAVVMEAFAGSVPSPFLYYRKYDPDGLSAAQSGITEQCAVVEQLGERLPPDVDER